jgi:hypothetical protein
LLALTSLPFGTFSASSAIVEKRVGSLAPLKFLNYLPLKKAIKFGIALTWKARAASYASWVFTAAKTKFSLSFAFAAASNVGLMRMHGGQVCDQKSTMRPGQSLINF